LAVASESFGGSFLRVSGVFPAETRISDQKWGRKAIARFLVSAAFPPPFCLLLADLSCPSAFSQQPRRLLCQQHFRPEVGLFACLEALTFAWRGHI
jgi:hypothetical protein